MSDHVPLIAVITRTKDRTLFLERAIQSVHSQTMKDFIHVIINDAGDPKPVDDLLTKYADKIDHRVKVIHNIESHGMEAATNKAIKSVDSKYIALHDDDDTWHPEFLRLTIERLEKGDCKGVLARTAKVTERLSSNNSSIETIKIEPYMSDVKVVNLYRQCIDNQLSTIAFVYVRNVLDEIGYYDEALPVCGDWDFGIRFMQKYDVELVDPGYALANYHHRQYIVGAIGNTSFAGNERHRYYSNKLMNKYLRQELAEGRLGVGYIMSQLKYEQATLASRVKKLLPGFLVNRLKKRVGG